MATHPQFELLGLTNQELTALVEPLGEPRFRARQLFDALYRQRLAALDDISNLPKSLRSRLVAAGLSHRISRHRSTLCLRRRHRPLPGSLRRWSKRGNRLDARWRRRGGYRGASSGAAASQSGSRASANLAEPPRHYLHLLPVGMRRELQVLHDRPAGFATQPHRRRDCWAGAAGSQ